jgi:hypothetical protein
VSIGSNFRTPHGTTTHSAFGNQRYQLSHFRDSNSRKWTPASCFGLAGIAKSLQISHFLPRNDSGTAFDSSLFAQAYEK